MIRSVGVCSIGVMLHVRTAKIAVAKRAEGDGDCNGRGYGTLYESHAAAARVSAVVPAAVSCCFFARRLAMAFASAHVFRLYVFRIIVKRLPPEGRRHHRPVDNDC